jgi:hypothetical protein
VRLSDFAKGKTLVADANYPLEQTGVGKTCSHTASWLRQPPSLPNAIVAISGGTLALFAKIHPLVTLVAFIAVVTSWLWIVSRTLQTRRKPAPATLITVSIATMMLALSMMWPLIEHALFRLLRA